MRPGTTRRFQISDALILIASTGLGLGGCRLWLSLVRGISFARGTVSVCSILLFGWTTALLLLRVASNRPRRRRLWCEPGFLACITVVFAYGWNTARFGRRWVAAIMTLSPAQDYWVIFSQAAMNSTVNILSPYNAHRVDVGGAVLLIWLVTWASGRCRPVPNWIDRAGRALGGAWVALTLLDAIVAGI
jgi:hypothetical protein